MKSLLLITASLSIASSSCEESKAHVEPIKQNEAHYRDQWAKANGGKTEIRLPDGTRCDVVTKTHAVEVEWAHKWYEGFGQALWYGFQLNKKPGVVMILRSEEDRRYLLRIRSLAAHHKIDLDVWTIPKD